MMVPVICMGYVQEDNTNYICPVDMGTKEIEGAGVTHSICPECLEITLDMLIDKTERHLS